MFIKIMNYPPKYGNMYNIAIGDKSYVLEYFIAILEQLCAINMHSTKIHGI